MELLHVSIIHALKIQENYLEWQIIINPKEK